MTKKYLKVAYIFQEIMFFPVLCFLNIALKQLMDILVFDTFWWKPIDVYFLTQWLLRLFDLILASIKYILDEWMVVWMELPTLHFYWLKFWLNNQSYGLFKVKLQL